MNVDILVSEELESPALDRLSRVYNVVREPDLWKHPARLNQQLRDTKVVMIRNQTKITAGLLKEARGLLGIGRVGVGLDNIDLQAATERRVVVIAPLSANAMSVAELAMGLLLCLARKIPAAERSTRSGGWDRKSYNGIELDGKTLALVGFGRIGRLVAARARAFGMNLRVFDPFIAADSPALKEVQATYCRKVEAALGDADFVTIHSPLTAETRHLFNQRTFGAMKTGAFLVNTSRGGVIDEQALTEALQSGKIAGAALDVREAEPPARGVFESMENVVLTPHIGAFTLEAQTRTFEAVCEDMERILRGEPALNYVNFPGPIKPAQP